MKTDLKPEALEALLHAYGDAVPFRGKQRVLASLRVAAPPKKTVPRLRWALLTGCLLLCSGFAFAFAQGWIALPRIEARQHETLTSEADGQPIQGKITFENRQYLTDSIASFRPSTAAYVHFDELDAAQALLPFPIAVPGHLPEGFVFYRASVLAYDEVHYAEEVSTVYRDPLPPYAECGLSQQYVGPEAALSLDSTEFLSPLVHEGRAYLCATLEEPFQQTTLYWLDGEYAFRLSCGSQDEALRIAASIRPERPSSRRPRPETR